MIPERSAAQRRRPPCALDVLLKLDRTAHADNCRIPDGGARIAWVRDIAARVNDVLDIRLDGPPWRDLRRIAEFEHDLLIADRIRRRERIGIAIARDRVTADLDVRNAERERIVRAARKQAFEPRAAVDVS